MPPTQELERTGRVRDGRVIAAQPAYPARPQHPLGAPTLSGTTITVDIMLNTPTRITRMIMDLSQERFITDRIYASAGGVTGGAVIFDIQDTNQLYTDRDAEQVSPGASFPIVTSVRLGAGVAPVEKWGAKTFITDEARDRNNAVLFTNQLRQMTNTLIRKINARGMAVLNAALANYPAQVIAGHNWQTVNLQGSSPTPVAQTPAADIAKAQQQAETQELGMVYDTLLLNPQEANQVNLIYSVVAGGWDAIAASWGITETYASPRIAPGIGYVIASQQAGGMRTEKPLGTETWREAETERTWVQASVRPVFYVDNPTAVVELTGLAG